MKYSVVPYVGQIWTNRSQSSQKFTGLSNQGATCYMNSLLQSLFMSPEFRQKLFLWVYDEEKHGDKTRCIPFQLQMLFGKLQVAKAPHVETKALTRSFGWDPKEGFQQHDVQEFCRVLLDAIEESVRGTPDENMVNAMYEGQMTDYVRCLKCEYESSRKDTFLDLSLTVRNEFDKVYNSSVQEALKNYIKPEELTGDNQYFCSSCETKQDAQKGLKFEKLPYILVLQLKRFDLDYNTFQRIKLNDRVTFPQILNANPFVRGGDFVEEEPSIPAEMMAADKENPVFKYVPADIDSLNLQQMSNTGHECLFEDREKKSLPMDSIVKERIIARQTEARKAEQQQKIEEYLKDGEFVYELFSIMIHSGSAMGGHYYAYIKSFEDNRWYNFNDSSVTELDEKEIPKVYGGTAKKTGFGSSYSANAYLLMYRKVDPTNVKVINDSEVPVYIKDELEALLEQDRLEAQERVEKYKQITLKVYYEKNEKTVTIKKDELFSTLKEIVIKEHELQDFKPENIRLRGYSQYYEIFQDVYKEDATIEEQGIWNYKNLAVEIKQDGTEWPPYNPNGFTVRVNLWSDDLVDDPRSLDEKTSNPRKLIVDKKQTVKEMLDTLETEFGIPVDNQVLLKKTYMGVTSQCEVMNTPTNLGLNLTYARIYEGTVFYLEEKSETGKWQQLFEKESRRYTIKFNHPDETSNQTSHTDYSYSVIVDCFSTLEVLKTAISQKLNIDPDEFIMKRGGKHCQEMKDMSLRLTQANLVNVSVIYIEKGKPTKVNEYRIQFSLAISAREEDGDAACYSFIDLFDLPIDSGILVSDIKVKLQKEIIDRFPTMEVDSSKMRLRERNSDRLSRVLKNTDMFRQYALFEKKNVAIQLLESEETQMDSEQMIIVVKRWWPSTWDISGPKEIAINKFGNLNSLGEILAEAFDIPHESLEVAKITYSWSFSRSDLKTETYYRTVGNLNHVGQNPWYLNLDGSLFFVKHKDEEVRELNDEEKRKFAKSVSFSNSYSGGTTWTYKPPQEKAIKINVHKKEVSPNKDDALTIDVENPPQSENSAGNEDSVTTTDANPQTYEDKLENN